MGEFDDIIEKARAKIAETGKPSKYDEMAARALADRQAERRKTVSLAQHASRLLLANEIPMDAIKKHSEVIRNGIFGIGEKRKLVTTPYGWIFATFKSTDFEGTVYHHARAILETDGTIREQDLVNINHQDKLLATEATLYETKPLAYFTEDTLQLGLGSLLIKHGLA